MLISHHLISMAARLLWFQQCWKGVCQSGPTPCHHFHLHEEWIGGRHLDSARQQALPPTLKSGQEAHATHKSER
jgi:hypothetical protein